MKISAYIPFYNNRDTIARAIDSVRSQSVPVGEFFTVNNGSTDGSAEIVASMGVRMISQAENQGRGAARGLGMVEAEHELVLCCDAAKALDTDFVKKAMSWFDNTEVGAVFGCVMQPNGVSVSDRWQGRHLYKIPPSEAQHHAKLATGGAILRAEAVRGVGGYAVHLRHGEDVDLGNRLLAAGHDVVCDPQLKIFPTETNTLPQVLERYWRWNTAPHGRMGIVNYLRQIVYSIRVMAREDLIAHDPSAALISLICPHYQFWMPLFSWRKSRA